VKGRLLALALVAWSLAAPASAGAFGFESFSASAVNSGGAPETQAGGHPYALHLDLAFDGSGGNPRDVTIHTPPGFLVNPTAVPECLASAFATPRGETAHEHPSASRENCPNPTQVGTIAVDVGGITRSFGLFNLSAPYGAAAAFGASPPGGQLLFAVHLREADAGADLSLQAVPASLDLRSLQLTIWGTPQDAVHDGQRGDCLNEAEPSAPFSTCGVLGGEGGSAIHQAPSLIKSYLTLPTTPCGSALPVTAEASSWKGQSAGASSALGPLSACNTDLTIASVKLMTAEAAARTGLEFHLHVNDGGGILNPGGIARPAISHAVLSLPEGLTINPSLAAGLGSCSEADFARESAQSEPGAGCPNSSKIGDVTVSEPLGLPEEMKGSLYLATPHANPYDALLGAYLVVRNARRGLAVKSVGEISPDARGRLTATFDQLPRLLYEDFTLTLREGNRSALLSPQSCGTYTADLAISSWAAPAALRHESSAFFITGACPSGGELPFAPGLIAGSLSPSPATYTPFYLRMTRTDPEQEITSYSASFPPGLLAKIAGVGECSDAAIAAASSRSGADELASPSCPEDSKVGHTMAGYGVGGTLAWAPGNLYLAGPWHDEPLSVVAIDAAKIGPFDLGVVVVRTAVHVDAQHAQASIDAAGSDPIPHIIDGIPLHVRDIRVYVDRPDFTNTPTSCDPLQVSSTLTGAGNDPFASGDESSATSTQRYQLLGCRALGFGPRFTLRLRGGTRRSSYPALRAEVRPRPGQVNIKAASVKLPPSLFLAQEHLHDVCTRAQFSSAGGNGAGCPPKSVYGHVRAWTPLLSDPLEGPVFIRSSDHPVPDLVAVLSGHNLNVVLEGRIDSVKGGLRGSFGGLPDAPLTKFVMNLPGGKKGLISVAEGLCGGHRNRNRANSRWVAQDNATRVLAPKVQVKCRRAHRKRHKRHHHRGAR
jgi:hypothetical protein